MRRATITLPDGLDDAVERFRREQPARPSLTSVVEAALEDYLGGTAIGGTGHPGAGAADLLSRVLRSRPEIRRIAAERGATAVHLFGSLARGEAGPASDVDLAVETASGTTLFDLAELRGDLEELLGAPVDVVPIASGAPAPDGALPL